MQKPLYLRIVPYTCEYQICQSIKKKIQFYRVKKFFVIRHISLSGYERNFEMQFNPFMCVLEIIEFMNNDC